MSTEPTLSQLRAEFGRSRMLSLPIAGAVAWSAKTCSAPRDRMSWIASSFWVS